MVIHYSFGVSLLTTRDSRDSHLDFLKPFTCFRDSQGFEGFGFLDFWNYRDSELRVSGFEGSRKLNFFSRFTCFRDPEGFGGIRELDFLFQVYMF